MLNYNIGRFRLPDAAVPPLAIVSDLILDSLIIAIVAYAISISMAKIFAHKHQYEVRPNQELIASVRCCSILKFNVIRLSVCVIECKC